MTVFVEVGDVLFRGLRVSAIVRGRGLFLILRGCTSKRLFVGLIGSLGRALAGLSGDVASSQTAWHLLGFEQSLDSDGFCNMMEISSSSSFR